MIQKDQTFFESLIMLLKELIIETFEKDKDQQEIKDFKILIYQNWIDLKPEIISLLSFTLNKHI